MSHDNPRDAAPSLWSRGPRIRALSTMQCEYVLARNHAGQLSFIARGEAELLPLSYVFADGTIFSRTSYGPKCAAWTEQPVVVFGVEEMDGLFDWRSVIVRGIIGIRSPHGTREERLGYWQAVEAMRSLVPDAFTERDPTPDRRVVFDISPVQISGREASTQFLSRSRS